MDTKELTALSQSIAKALGAEWYVKVDEDNYSRRISNRKRPNAALYVQNNGYNTAKKCSISGDVRVDGKYIDVYEPREGSGWYRAVNPSISVTIARGPEIIAKEITRRLLPEYLRILTLAEAQVAKEKAYAANKQSNLERLAAVAWVILRKREEYNQPQTEFRATVGSIRTDVKVNGDSTADIVLNDLTIEQAERIIALIREENF